MDIIVYEKLVRNFDKQINSLFQELKIENQNNIGLYNFRKPSMMTKEMDRQFINDPVKQLQEVIEHYKLKIQPHHVLTLCPICNQKLREISSLSLIHIFLQIRIKRYMCGCVMVGILMKIL